MFDFVIGIVDFILDIVLLRKVREARKRPERSWHEDASDVAYFEWWLVPVSLAIATAGALILLFGFGFSFWLSIGAPLVLIAIYWVYRYMELVNR